MLSHPMTRPRRLLLSAAAIVAAAVGVVACGEQKVNVSKQYEPAAHLFVQRCSGCHTLGVAATEGSATNVRTREYKDGPNFDQRIETRNCVIYAIRNGGFSGAIMPQNLAVGEDAVDLAKFVSRYAGKKAKRPPGPTTPPPSGF